MFLALLVGLGPFTFSRADEPASIALRPGAVLYSAPNRVDDNPSFYTRRYWNMDAQRCRLAAGADGVVKGKATPEGDGLVRVDLDATPADCAADFRGRGKSVFVKKSDVVFADGEGGVIARAKPGDDDTDTAAGVCLPGFPCAQKKGRGAGDRAILEALGMKGIKEERYQKDSAQQELYFKCHATPHQANYEKFRELFEVAGEAFVAAYDPVANKTRAILNPAEYKDAKVLPFLLKVSPSALKCLALRESRWDPLQKSDTGAMGLTQQVAANVKDVGCKLYGCSVMNPKTKELEPKAAEPWAQDVWGNYFDTLRTKKHRAAYRNGMTHPVTQATCAEQMKSKDDALCPANSIASGAINALIAQASIRRNSYLRKSEKNIDLGERDAYLALVIATAANNAGSGTLAKAIASGERPSQWLEHLDRFEKDPKRREEIRNYAKYMDHCMKKDDFAPVDPIKPEEAGRDWKKYCEDKVAKTARAGK